jgi:hypothetical protein
MEQNPWDCNVLMYGSETWPLRRTDERRLEAAEMRFIRCVAGCIYCVAQGKERRNKGTTRNEEVGQTNTRKEEELAGISTEDAIRKAPRQLLYYQPIGRRD